MKSIAAIFICMDALLGITGCINKKPSTDPGENKFYSVYRDIYYSYKKIPVDSTRAKLEAYLSKFPENSDAWAFYGNVCFKTGDYEKARTAYLRAIREDKGKGTYYSSLGAVYGIEDKIDSAEKYLLKGVELKDSSGYTLLNLAMLYRHKNEPGKAIEYADAASLKNDSSALVCAGLSYVYYQLGEAQKSAALAQYARLFGLSDTAGLNNVLNGTSTIDDFYRKNY